MSYKQLTHEQRYQIYALLKMAHMNFSLLTHSLLGNELQMKT